MEDAGAGSPESVITVKSVGILTEKPEGTGEGMSGRVKHRKRGRRNQSCGTIIPCLGQ